MVLSCLYLHWRVYAGVSPVYQWFFQAILRQKKLPALVLAGSLAASTRTQTDLEAARTHRTHNDPPIHHKHTGHRRVHQVLSSTTATPEHQRAHHKAAKHARVLYDRVRLFITCKPSRRCGRRLTFELVFIRGVRSSPIDTARLYSILDSPQYHYEDNDTPTEAKQVGLVRVHLVAGGGTEVSDSNQQPSALQ